VAWSLLGQRRMPRAVRLGWVVLLCLGAAGCAPADDVGAVAQDVASCDPVTFTSTCAGNTLTMCHEGKVTQWACGPLSVCNARRASCGYCGDGARDPGEGCDDANGNDWDTCRSDCTMSPTCDPLTFAARCDGNTLTTCFAGYQTPMACGAGVCNAARPACGSCGDGARDPGEECDDANLNDWDACSNLCRLNGACDPLTFAATCDGDTLVTCLLGTLVRTRCDGACNTAAGRCGACGDGVVDPGEACDDGNHNDWDACRADCTDGPLCDPLAYPRCEGNTLVLCASGLQQPRNCGAAVCDPVAGRCGACGDGVRDPGEECDVGDGCLPDCTLRQCDEDADCDDGDACTGDRCGLDGRCAATHIAGCCETSRDCPVDDCHGAICSSLGFCVAIPDYGDCPELCEQTKVCDGQCLGDGDPAHGCGAAGCEPCAPPAGGAATCEDGACAALCPPGTKLCGDACVSTSDAGFGCGATSCEPCTDGLNPDVRGAHCEGEEAPACVLECEQGMVNCGSGCCQCNEDLLCDAGEDREGCPSDCGCADFVCDPLEAALGDCPRDCTCGNGVCDPGEQGVDNFDEDTFCESDCFCGNGTCEPGDGEDNTWCADCAGYTCGLNQKLCGVYGCVSLDDPQFGCGDGYCRPCPPSGDGTTTCELRSSGGGFRQECVLECEPGARVCDGRCEQPRPDNGCGAADCQPCRLPHVLLTTCANGTAGGGCTFDDGDCERGWEDVDRVAANGCETPSPAFFTRGLQAWWRTDLGDARPGWFTPDVSSNGVIYRIYDQGPLRNSLIRDRYIVDDSVPASPYLMKFNDSGRECAFFEGKGYPHTLMLSRRFTESTVDLRGKDYTIISVVGREAPKTENWFFVYGRPENRRQTYCGRPPGEFDSEKDDCPNTWMYMGWMWEYPLGRFIHDQWLNAIDAPTPTALLGSFNPSLIVATLDQTTGRSLTVNGFTTTTGDRRPMDQTFTEVGIGGVVPSYVNESPPPDGTPRFRGWFCEMLIYDRALEPLERGFIEYYLKRKWKLP
jgi:cysteine-rich repeat protein